MPTPICVAKHVLRIVVVVAAAAHPVTWLHPHGRAMGVVAFGAACEIVVAAHRAEPITLRPFL